MEFPHLVQMHKQHAKDGVVAMAVSLDPADDREAMKSVRAFLQESKADFPTFVLNEDQQTWQGKLGIEGPPAVFVFGRDGKLAKRFTEGVDYQEIEKFVRDLLQK